MINIQVIFRFLVLSLFMIFSLLGGATSYAESAVNVVSSKGKIYVSIDLDDGDIIYWYKKTKLGLPTKIEIYDEVNVDNYLIDWPWPQVKKEGNIQTPFYSNKVMIPIYVKPISIMKPSTFQINLSYLICNKGGCYPKLDHLTAKVDEQSSSDYHLENIADKVYFLNNRLVVETSLTSHADIMIMHNNELYLPDFHKNHNEFIDFYFLIDNLKDYGKIEILNSLSSNSQTVNIKEIKTEEEEVTGFLLYAVFAFLGGFILNFMPCVLPILSLKLYSLMNARDPKDKKIEAGLSFCTIVGYFVGIGILTAIAKDAGEYFTAGFNLQSPSVLISCIVLITIVMSVVRGKLNLNLDAIIPNFHSRSKYINIITTTLASTILATPCTAPFLATSMTFALTQTSEIIILMFFISSIGFGFPYVMIIFYPKALKFLPKSGKWQEFLKILFVVLLLLTMTWLLWILYNQLGLYPMIATLLFTYFVRYSIEENIRINYKILIFILAIFGMFTIPNFVSRNFHQLESTYTKSWEVFSQEKLEKYLNDKECVFVYVTAEWCVTCQVNKLMVLDRLPTILLFKEHNVKLLEANLTNPNDEANKFLLANHSSGLPFAKVYSPGDRNGIALPVLFTYGILENAISQKMKD